MSVVDIIILVLFGIGLIVGFKSGVIKKTVDFVGTIVIFIVAFIFKNNLSVLMYEHLPFFNLGGIMKGLDVINILIYEVLAFLIVFSVLLLILKLLLKVTGIIENILKATIILSIPSKILGMVVGVIEMYFFVFIALTVMTLPIFNVPGIKDSKIANFMLDNTPVLSSMHKEMFDIYDEVNDIIDKKDKETSEELNGKIVKLFIEKEIITKESALKLVNDGKLHISDKSILN